MNKKTQQFLILFALAAFVFQACSILRPASMEEYATEFQSHPNGMADINLKLHPNARFDFTMTLYPQPGESVSQEPEHLHYKGKWRVEKNHYIVEANKRSNADWQIMFDDMSTTLGVIDRYTFTFPQDNEEITIWGVRCFRK